MSVLDTLGSTISLPSFSRLPGPQEELGHGGVPIRLSSHSKQLVALLDGLGRFGGGIRVADFLEQKVVDADGLHFGAVELEKRNSCPGASRHLNKYIGCIL